MNATPMTTALDPILASRLARMTRRIRTFVFLENAAWVLLFLFVAAWGQWVLDFTSRGMRWSMRATLLVLIVATAVVLIFRWVVAPLRLRFGAAEMAHFVERRYPKLSSTLVSAVRFSAGQVGPANLNSPGLIQSVIESAGRQTVGLDFDGVLNPRRARRAVAGLAVAAVIALIAVVSAPQSAYLWLARNVLLRDLPLPKRTHLTVDNEQGYFTGAKGDDLIITAHATGVRPREVEIFFRMQSGQRGRQSMITVGGESAYRYRYTFEKAQEDFTFFLRGGDDETEEFSVRLLDRPKVERTAMRIVPPAYSGLETLDLPDGRRAAQVLRGSEVTLWIETNHPVRRAVLMSGEKSLLDAEAEGARQKATVVSLETQSYHFHLVDEAGLENREIMRFSVQVMKDEPPRVRAKLPGVGDMITPNAVLPMELSFEDPFGLATVEVVLQFVRDPVEEQVLVPPAFRPKMTTLSTTLSWPVASSGLVPGERLVILARASDFDTVSGPNQSRSPEVNLRIVTPEELLAELSRREREFRSDFERLIDGQEQLRGRLLTLWGQFTEQERVDVVREGLRAAERTQRNLTASVNIVRQQFERILAELQVNQLESTEVRGRIGDGIIDPLAQLVKRDLTAAADKIGQWASGGSQEVAKVIDRQQAEILAQMRTILANMSYREGYQEIVNMLRDIIRLQQDLSAESKKTLEEQADDVFDE
jgi:hypothetical protein